MGGDVGEGAPQRRALHGVGAVVDAVSRGVLVASVLVPAGFVTATAPAGLSPELRDAWLDMKATRREEGYGDLVGLAWTRRHHPDAYAPLHAWLVGERSRNLQPGSHHDTLAWVRLAGDGSTLVAGPSIFGAAAVLWQAGLKTED